MAAGRRHHTGRAESARGDWGEEEGPVTGAGRAGAGFRGMEGDIYMEVGGLVKCGCGRFVCAVVWWVVRGVVLSGVLVVGI